MSCRPSTVFLALLGMLAIIMILNIILYHETEHLEHLEQPKEGTYAKCPDGYILSGALCIPDDIQRPHTCDKYDQKKDDGMCMKEETVVCPDGFLTMATHCYNPKTKEKKPFSDATCPDGYTREGAFCHLEYAGSCPPYFKNTKAKPFACAQEMPSISPWCDADMQLKDGKCYSSAIAAAFAKSTAVEQKAFESLSA